MDFAKLSFLLFALFSSLRIVSYIPQIRRVALDGNGASAISYSTWTLWTGANLATALYATINLGDVYLAAVSGIYAVCCVVVIVLTMLKRHWIHIAEHNKPAARAAAPEHPDAADAVRVTVQEAAVALAANRRPHYAFEQELAAQARRVVWQDLAKALESVTQHSLGKRATRVTADCGR